MTIDKAGNVVQTSVNGASSGGQNASAASAGRQTGGSDSLDYQRQRANDQMFGLAGKAGALGGRMFDTYSNPFLSGGEQTARASIEAARAAAAALPNAASLAAAQSAKGQITPGMAAGMIEDSRKFEKAGEIVGSAAAKVMEVAMQKLSTVAGQANQTVGGIAAQYASAGVKLSDQQIDSMLKMETARQTRIYDAQSRVASRSGNISADLVNEVQSSMQDAMDQSRKMGQAAKLGNAQAGGLGIVANR